VAQRLDLFLSELGLDRFHLVGHDVGAWVAFTYAATFRSKIETLTVIDAGISRNQPPGLRSGYKRRGTGGIFYFSRSPS